MGDTVCRVPNPMAAPHRCSINGGVKVVYVCVLEVGMGEIVTACPGLTR